jgi:long-chain acyl-CoA synthetase
MTTLESLTAPGQPFELVPAGADGSGGLEYRNAPRSLRELIMRTSATASDAGYLVYEVTTLSEAEHDARCRQLAAFLIAEYAIAPGDRVALAMRNLPEFSIAFWAIQSLGAVAVPLNAWSSGSELAAAVRHSASAVLIADGDRLERLGPELAGLDLRGVLVTAAEPPQLGRPITPLPTVFAGPAVWTWPAVEVGPDDPATIVYTSGTTGSPKGAIHIQRNYCTAVMHNLLNLELARRQQVDAPPTAAPRADGPKDCMLLTYPLFHIAGLLNLCLSMGQRTKVVLMHHWDPLEAAHLIEHERVTRALLVPTTLRSLLSEAGARLAAAPDLSLQSIGAGGASVPAELIRGVVDTFGGRVAPGNGYGLTETTAGVIVFGGPEYANNPASIGRPRPGTEVRIADLVGAECAVGAVGEILVRGPNVCIGYWNDPAETARSFEHGWFHTGDLGKVDENGLYYVVGRIKEVIIRGGENVFCPEVEAALEGHPGVLEAAVFGLPDEEFGEIVGAVVRRLPTVELGEDELRSYLGERLAYYKVPARMAITEQELPKKASGKVLKRELRESWTARTVAVARTVGDAS